jgi:UDP-N-acetylmuramyl pentapeptide synthase
MHFEGREYIQDCYNGQKDAMTAELTAVSQLLQHGQPSIAFNVR